MIGGYVVRCAFVAVVCWWVAGWIGERVNEMYEGMAAKVGGVAAELPRGAR